MTDLPVGAYVATALMAANISCDSGEDVDRFLVALTATPLSLVRTDDLAGLRTAAEQAYGLLAQMDKQALNPGPDHLVAITVEAWRDSIRPVISLIRAALEAKGTRP